MQNLRLPQGTRLMHLIRLDGKKTSTLLKKETRVYSID